MNKCYLFFLTLLCAAIPPAANALTVKTEKDIAVPGEKITFTITRSQRKLSLYPAVQCTLYCGEKILETHRLDGIGTHIFSLTAPAEPSWIYAKAEYIDNDGKKIIPRHYKDHCGAGILTAPEKIAPAAAEPDDFNAFWKSEITALRNIKMEVSRKKVPSPVPGVRAEDIRINTNTTIPVSGYLLVPENASPKSLPAIVYFHGAGVRSAIMQKEFSKKAIVFDVNAHGVANGMPKEYYRKLASTELKHIVFRNADTAGKSYIKNMFLRTVRALDFIKSSPEWDGRTLIVFGRSQGGAQALAAAALVPEVSLCIANVPALADHAGFTAGRKSGWPGLCRKKSSYIRPSTYVDVANLARRIRCRTRLTAGMIDTVCPPSSVTLIKNCMGAPTELYYFQNLSHNAPPPDADGRKLIYGELAR